MRPIIACLPLAAAMVIGCGDSSVGPGQKLDSSVIRDEVDAVFLPNMDSLAARGVRLNGDIAAFAASPTAEALLAAKGDWRLARASYEFGEAFSFGPIETDGIDPAVDTWPIDTTGINALIAGTTTFSAAMIDGLPVTLKGFHAVEFVLFGDPDAPTTATNLSARQLQYLVAAGQDLSNELTNLRTAWLPSAGNFAGQVLNAGGSSSVYSSQIAAMRDIITQMASQPGQVIFKLQQPLEAHSSIYEESRFSDNTLGDITSNIAGTAALYFGSINSTPHGSGLGAIVAANDPTLDAAVRSQFADVEAKIALIAPSFDVALHQDPNKLADAENAALVLQKTMINLVAPLLGVGNVAPLGGQPDPD